DSTGLHVLAEGGVTTVQPVGNGPKYTLTGFGDPVINDQNDVAYVAGGPAMILGDQAVIAYAGEGDTVNGQTQNLYSVSLDAAGPVVFLETVDIQGEPTPNLDAIAAVEISNPLPVSILVKSLDPGGTGQIAVGNPGTSVPMISSAGIVFRAASFVGFNDD